MPLECDHEVHHLPRPLIGNTGVIEDYVDLMFHDTWYLSSPSLVYLPLSYPKQTKQRIAAHRGSSYELASVDALSSQKVCLQGSNGIETRG